MFYHETCAGDAPQATELREKIWTAETMSIHRKRKRYDYNSDVIRAMCVSMCVCVVVVVAWSPWIQY